MIDTSRRLAVILSLTVVVGVAGEVSGQDSGVGTSSTAAPLSLEEALDRALLNNPGYRQSLNNLDINEIAGREYWLDVMPQLSLDLLTTSMNWNRQSVGTDNFGNPVPNPDFRMIQSARSRQGATVSLSLDFADILQRRVVRLDARSRELSATTASYTLTLDVRRSFVTAQQRSETLELEERLIAIQQTNLEITERLFGLARVDRPELLSARLDYADQENQLTTSRAELATALLDLRNVIGDPDLRPEALRPEPLRIFDPALLDAEALVAAALDAGPGVRQALLELDRAEASSSVAGSRRWLPTLQLSARTGRDELSRDSGGAFFRPVPDGEWDRSLGFTLSFPNLGNYFDNRAAGRREEIDVRNAAARVRQERLDAEGQIRRLLIDLEIQYRTLISQESRAELARERYELQQERYRFGQIDYRDLQSSVQDVSGSERQTLQARYAFELSLMDLERSVGAEIPIPRTP